MGLIGDFLAGSGGNLLSTGMNWIATASQNKKSRKWSSAEAEKAWDREVAMWNMSNEYNSPKSQMQRFKDAGLNPNLIYEKGNPGNTATTMPQYHPAEGKYGGFNFDKLDVIGAYQDYKLKKEVINNTAKNGEILEEEKSAKILENIAKVFNLATDTGQDIKIQDGKYYWDLPDEFPEGKGLKYYQIQGKEADNALKAKKILTEIQNARYKKALANWAFKKIREMNKNKINIDKDDVVDRILMGNLQGTGQYASVLRKLLPVLSALRK